MLRVRCYLKPGRPAGPAARELLTQARGGFCDCTSLKFSRQAGIVPGCGRACWTMRENHASQVIRRLDVGVHDAESEPAFNIGQTLR
ncbi:hypothetical protein P3T16_001554 [Paraburkholderia sp. GAS42]